MPLCTTLESIEPWSKTRALYIGMSSIMIDTMHDDLFHYSTVKESTSHSLHPSPFSRQQGFPMARKHYTTSH